jgi:hypothetical protein
MSDNLRIKDADSTIQTVKATDVGGGLLVPHHNIDSIANPVTVVGSLPLSLPATSTDAFSRLRVSAPGYRFDSQLTYGIDTDLWDTLASGTGVAPAHSATERWATLSATAGLGSSRLQSHYHAPYTPGRGQLAFITFLFGSTPGTGAVRKAGYYDGTNGVYLEQSATGVNLVLASGTSKGTETVAQASWNMDTLGAGALNPSGKTLDLTKMQILVIQMQALYVGRATIGFDIGGEIIPVHAFDCANEEAFPYLQQASLPVYYEASTSSAAVTMRAVCASVISEGGNDLQNMAGREFSADRGVTARTVGATELPLVSIQVAAQLNSINQNAVVIPMAVEVSVATDPILVRVRRNPVLTGASFAAVSATESVVNSDVAASAVSGGRVVDSFYIPASNTIRSTAERGLSGKTVLAYRHIATASGDILSVTAQATTGTGAVVLAALKWKEIR